MADKNVTEAAAKLRKKMDEFLDEVGAHLIREFGEDMRMYHANGKVFLVQYLRPCGWEIFLPATPSLLISDNLEATRKYIGIKKEV